MANTHDTADHDWLAGRINLEAVHLPHSSPQAAEFLARHGDSAVMRY
jgi:hypothetical protein